MMAYDGKDRYTSLLNNLSANHGNVCGLVGPGDSPQWPSFFAQVATLSNLPRPNRHSCRGRRPSWAADAMLNVHCNPQPPMLNIIPFQSGCGWSQPLINTNPSMCGHLPSSHAPPEGATSVSEVCAHERQGVGQTSALRCLPHNRQDKHVSQSSCYMASYAESGGQRRRGPETLLGRGAPCIPAVSSKWKCSVTGPGNVCCLGGKQRS